MEKKSRIKSVNYLQIFDCSFAWGQYMCVVKLVVVCQNPSTVQEYEEVGEFVTEEEIQ